MKVYNEHIIEKSNPIQNPETEFEPELAHT